MREQVLNGLRSSTPWEVVIIGGGATGLGTALDAANRGFRTLLIESHDFAKGTSSRSTKLIHGGVRYLAQGNLALVREALAEQKLLLNNAPHIVHEIEFVVPGYTRWSLPYYGLGLWMYDQLAGRSGGHRSRKVGLNDTLGLLFNLERTHLRGAIVYRDGQFDDARLAICLMRSAQMQGAVLANYVRASGFVTTSGKISGVLAEDVETGEKFQFSARVVINATGVFSDEIRRLDDAGVAPLLRPSRGSHLVLGTEFLPGSAALMIPKTDDGRVLFAIPWNERVLVGTTDVPVDQTPEEPQATENEVDFLLGHLGRYLERAPVAGDVKSVFSGLRPLIASRKGDRSSKLSREHVISISDRGLVTIAGGKWTTYRRMASDVTNEATRVGGLPSRPCGTANLRLQGWTDQQTSGFFARYGSDSGEIEELGRSIPDGLEPLHPALPYRKVEVIWGARRELARTVEDILARRTRSLVLDAQAAIESAPEVASLLANELGRDEAWRTAELGRFVELARHWKLPSDFS